MITFPTILKKTPSDYNKLKYYLQNEIGKETSFMLNPCYYPKIARLYNNLKHMTDINEDNIEDFQNQLKKSKEYGFSIINDKNTILYIVSISHFSRINRDDIAELFFTLLSIKFYGNIVYRYLKYCKSDYWTSSLEKLSNKHIFNVRSGIANSIMYFANEEYKKNKIVLGKLNITEDALLRVIYVLRHRINQSFRSFMNKYYELEKEGMKVGSISDMKDEIEVKNIELIASEVSNAMCTYGFIDKNSLNDAINHSGIRRSLGEETIKLMSQVTYSDKIRFIIFLIDKIDSVKNLCKKDKQTLTIRKMVSDNKIQGYSIKDNILEILYSLENGYVLKSVNTMQLLIFFSIYLTGLIRSKIC